MWTVNARKQVGINGTRQVALIFENPSYASITEVFTVGSGLTNEFLSHLAKLKIDQLSSQDVAYEAITEGPVTPRELPAKSDPEIVAEIK